jgi:hypothetical protein
MSVTVVTSSANFNEEKYAEDLDTCRGGSAADAALHGLGGMAAGSSLGASEGFTQWGFSGVHKWSFMNILIVHK